MDIETGGSSIVQLIRELTGTESVTRTYDYCDVFKHNPFVLSSYLGNAEGEGSGWAFRGSWGTLRIQTTVGQSVADLIKFAYHLKNEPLDVAATWATEFVKRPDTRWRHIFTPTRLRPLVRAGVGPQYAAALLFRGATAPAQQDAFLGRLDRQRSGALIGNRIVTEREAIIRLWQDGIPVEYAEAFLP